MKFNIIFAGTPDFSTHALSALIASQHQICAVYTQPDRPAGRGRQLTASPVKALALQHQLPVFQPQTLRDPIEQQKLADLQADIMVVVAYGLLLPKAVLTAPRLGCLNIHASLLPRWRGAAPIQRAILAGDARTGITIMQMDEGLDTGAMLYKTDCAISASDTSETLHEKLAVMGADAILHVLNHLTELKPEIQDNAQANYAQKIKKEEAVLDWQQSAQELDQKIRAFNPWPVAFFANNIRVWQAKVLADKKHDALPGTVLAVSSEGIDVATGQGVLRLMQLQFPGGRVLSAVDILNARKNDFAVGNRLG